MPHKWLSTIQLEESFMKRTKLLKKLEFRRMLGNSLGDLWWVPVE